MGPWWVSEWAPRQVRVSALKELISNAPKNVSPPTRLIYKLVGGTGSRENQPPTPLATKEPGRLFRVTKIVAINL